MPEWGPLLFWPAYLYLAAALAGGVALAVRGARSKEQTSLSEARWRALLAPGAVLLLPLWTAAFPHSALVDGALHRLWHHWEATVHGSPALHALLHWGNLALVLLAGLSLARVAAAVARERAFAGTMAAYGERGEDHPTLPLYRLPGVQPVCFTLGWLRPRVYLSRSLEEQLSDEDLRAILAHEREHVVRRDGLLGGILTLFYTLLPVPGAALLLRDWRGAAERACDAAAAEAVGSRTAVARALVQAARVAVRTPKGLPGTAGFIGEEDVEGRVRALMAPKRFPASIPVWRWAAGSVLLLAAPVLHHVAALLVHH